MKVKGSYCVPDNCKILLEELEGTLRIFSAADLWVKNENVNYRIMKQEC